MRFLFFILIFFISCKKKATDSLIGTWRKDSSTNGPTTRLSRPYESGTFVFKDDGTYNYSWSADDVMDSDTGRYFIIDTVNRLKILKLEKGIGYFSEYIILERNNYQFKMKSRHSYNAGDSTIYFDMIDVFNRIE